MGLEDIAYDLIQEFRAAKSDKQKQMEIAKSLAKKAYLRFNFEWTTEMESGGVNCRFDRQRQILHRYSQIFLDIAGEIHDILPEESLRMKNVAATMKSGAHGDLTHSSNGVTPVGDRCADKVTEFVQEIIE
jgi:hypothetical protein